ncbi:MAG: type VI secretion system tip protein VgrG [Rhizobiales bacterium]|nr:type VI secretion system tip protein VgrG [Hyphomicrobiales bacterium]
MEFEGICYFFEHADGKHTLVLTDDIAAHPMVPGYDEIPYFSRDDRSRRERDHIYDWRVQAVVEPGQVTLQSFDYLKPKADLMSVTSSPRDHLQAEGEIYDYPGCYTELSRGEALTQVRLDERHCEHLRAFGAGTAGGLASGHLFALKQYPRQDQNAEYMVVRVEHEIWSEAYRAASPDADHELYLGRFEAMPSTLRFRPRQTTRKPIVQGPQTAIVTGKAGEEIWTNEHGCVKVQFHWDREGRQDENTSCWVRVSQAWAGAGFGGIHIPRIGQEVVVDFLEGDPDRPLITGRVYNALATVPYGLPGNATQSGIKSNSSKGGGGSNELRFEDKAGEEHVYLHAQKDEMIVVEHDKSEEVRHDETIAITNDRTETVGNNETLTVVADRTRDVGANETVTIGLTRTDTVKVAEFRNVLGLQNQFVGAARAVEVVGGQAHVVGIYDTWEVTGYRSVDVSQNDSLDVGGDHKVDVKGQQTVAVTKDQGVTITGARSLTVKKGRTTNVTEDDATTVGKTITISAGDTITIKNDKASITMADNGDITIVGENIKIEAKGKMDAKVKNNLKMEAQKILQN